MKKLIFLLIPAIILSCIVLLTGSSSNLYLLNWGEYIDPSLITKFEQEYNTTVIMEEVGSSEDMYQKIKSNITPYDIAIPGDYMVERMYQEDMINKLDLAELSNYSDDMFNDDLTGLRKNSFFEDNEEYCIPYFWGAYCLIYSTRKDYVETTVKANNLDAILNRSVYGEHKDDVKLAMYSVPRFGTTAYLLDNGIDINTNKVSDFTNLVTTMKAANYDLWADDNIKKQIAAGNIDVGFTQLGDFFDQYYLSTRSNEDIQFSCYIPDKTSAFFDAMVIPKTSKNTELAYDFINFMLDTDNSFLNTTYVGYSPTLKSVVNKLKEDDDYTDLISKYPFYIDPLQGKKATLFRYIEEMDDGTNYLDFLQNLINEVKA
ncbi:MAG: extracellular solute-binding protein [Bacilli bacterium]|jgi:spermidine/putrescine-binding protein